LQLIQKPYLTLKLKAYNDSVTNSFDVMPRGGHRDKAGRRSTWKSGCNFSETKLIRVPTAISSQLLDIAHRLDAGESLELVTNSKDSFVDQSFTNEVEVFPGQLNLLELCSTASAANSITEPSLHPLSARALSLRLGSSKSGSTVLAKKSKPDFEEWTRSEDPEKVGWIYNKQDKLFYPVK